LILFSTNAPKKKNGVPSVRSERRDVVDQKGLILRKSYYDPHIVGLLNIHSLGEIRYIMCACNGIRRSSPQKACSNARAVNFSLRMRIKHRV